MLPVKIIMADDEPGILLLLHTIFSELEGALVVGTAENAAAALKLVKEKSPHLALLDIELPDMTGLELAERLREMKPDLFIVFITGHQEYSLDAFKLYATDYILKPINEERVKATFQRIQQILKLPGSVSPASALHPHRISINLGNEKVFIKLNEVFYLEKSGHHTLICCDSGKFKVRETLQDLETRLEPNFFRSHKSYIVNVDRIERIINYPNSSYYEIKFKNYENKALLSRERINALMAYSHLNI